MPNRAAVLMTSVWLGATAAATGVGVLAVQQVAQGVGGPTDTPLTEGGVRAALSEVPDPSSEPATATPAPSPTPTASARWGSARTVTTAGGVVSGRCRDGVPLLLYAVPADGYRTVPGNRSVVFRSGSGSVRVELRCRGDAVSFRTSDDDEREPSDAPTSPGGGDDDQRTATPRPASPSPRPEPSESPERSPSPEASETPDDDS